MFAFAFAAALAAAAPQGDRLPEGTWCYTITASNDGTTKTIGHAFQSLERLTHDGKPALKIVVHQRMGTKFDLRDTFVLDASTMRPLEFANERFGKPRVRDVYFDGKVVETLWDDAGNAAIRDKPLRQPVWEGNLYGLLFAALPLAQGDTYSIPYYQYDKGESAFVISVTGQRTIDTPAGKREAVVVQAGPSPEHQVEYWIGINPRIELGYGAPQGFAQTLAPSCAAFEAAALQ